MCNKINIFVIWPNLLWKRLVKFVIYNSEIIVDLIKNNSAVMVILVLLIYFIKS